MCNTFADYTNWVEWYILLEDGIRIHNDLQRLDK